MIYSLLETYGLLKTFDTINLDDFLDEETLVEWMLTFHSEEYLQALRKNFPNEAFGLVDDCPVFPYLWEYSSCCMRRDSCSL